MLREGAKGFSTTVMCKGRPEPLTNRRCQSEGSELVRPRIELGFPSVTQPIELVTNRV